MDRVNQLVQRGAKVNCVNEQGWSPLHLSCWMGQSKYVHYLLKQGALVNAKNHESYTPLKYAIDMSLPVSKLLLSYGGDDSLKYDTDSDVLISGHGCRRWGVSVYEDAVRVSREALAARKGLSDCEGIAHLLSCVLKTPASACPASSLEALSLSPSDGHPAPLRGIAEIDDFEKCVGLAMVKFLFCKLPVGDFTAL
jgi:hypothetical protein